MMKINLVFRILKNLLVNIASLYFVSSFSNLYSQTDKSKYLNSNHINRFIEVDSVFGAENDYRLYLSGELHGKTGNKTIELDLLKKLYFKRGVRYLIIENSSYYVGLLSSYLMSPEDSVEYYFERIVKYNLTVSSEEKKYYTSLRLFWQSLPKGDKFSLIGVDVNHLKFIALYDLLKLLPPRGNGYSDPIFERLSNTYDKRRISTQKVVKLLESTNDIILKDEAYYKTILTDKYEQFMLSLKGSLIGLKKIKKYDAPNLNEREIYMAEAIAQLYKKDPKAVIFGQFGRAHTCLSEQKNWLHLKNWLSLAAMLNTNDTSYIKGKVCSILLYYPADSVYETKHYIEPIIKKEDIPLFLNYCETQYTLFKLDRNDSPFMNIAEKFQYLLINKE